VTRPSLFTDHYELTMLQASLADGTAQRRCVFELFARRLPPGRRYGVVAGIGRILDGLPDFRFSADDLAFLRRTGVVDEPTVQWLAEFRFSGDIWGYREGELYFPYSPILSVEATFGEAVILETWLLSVLNHDSAVASAASRMVTAAAGRPIIEMGSRRTHEESAVAAARAAYLAGLQSTSNLAAGRRYGIPTRGTSAHAFTLVHDSEQAAFASQVASLGAGTTLLIDTFDTEQGAARAVDTAGSDLGAVRLDSGDLAEHARRVRAILDRLGATGTRIVATGDLDEYRIQALAGAPIDGYGVGTRLVTGSGAPTAEMVYKLVARSAEPGANAPLVPVWKTSEEKATVGGRKAAYRALTDGTAATEVVVVDRANHQPPPEGTHRDLMVELVRSGQPIARPSLLEAREHHRRSLAELPADALLLEPGEPAIPTEHV
jgi:nicotinate phosphoribosyltransferase